MPNRTVQTAGQQQRPVPGNWLKGLMLVLGLLLAPFTHAAEQIIYYHFDALGSPVAASDATGNYYLWKETYRPYGERIQKQPNSVNNARWYTGKPQDDETGLSYFGARYYDPVIGRFLGVDPKEFTEKEPHSFNRYAYANNNPYKYIDPDGQAAVLVLIPPVIIGGIIYYAATPDQRAQMGRAVTQMGQNLSGNVQWLGGKIGSLIFKEDKGSDQGCIYCVSGDKTSSGKPYVGSTDNKGQREKDKSDGRDRTGAEVVDTYPKGNRDERRQKEQQAINDRGGVENLDNRRNEVAPKNWEGMGIKPPQ